LKNLFLERNCLISANKIYRWSLSYKISKSKKEIIFIGLNPSLSDAVFLDNTTKKIIKISKNNNYGKVKLIKCVKGKSTSNIIRKIKNVT